MRIGPFVYRLKLRTIVDHVNQSLGSCFNNQCEIHLREEYDDPQTAVDTLWHEVTHAFIYCAGLEKGDSDERICHAFGGLLMAFVRDNPQVIRWMMKSLGAASDEQICTLKDLTEGKATSEN